MLRSPYRAAGLRLLCGGWVGGLHGTRTLVFGSDGRCQTLCWECSERTHSQPAQSLPGRHVEQAQEQEPGLACGCRLPHGRQDTQVPGRCGPDPG